jgi:hypothetical protein
VGIATENKGRKGASEDLVVLNARDWTADMQEEAERIQKEASLLLDKNVKKTEGRISEWPKVSAAQASNPGSEKLNRKQRRTIESKRRRRSK